MIRFLRFRMILSLFLFVLILISTLHVAAVQANEPYRANIISTTSNCYGTRVFGIVRDNDGNRLSGVQIRLWATDGRLYETTSNEYGWNFALDDIPIYGRWYVAVQDGHYLLSKPLKFMTAGTCNPLDANEVEIEIVNGPPLEPTPEPPTPTPEAESTSEASNAEEESSASAAEEAAVTGAEEVEAEEASTTTEEATRASSASTTATDTFEIAPALTSDASCLWFTETAGEYGGFSVCDDKNANFRSAFERYGLQNVGYPISIRFKRNGIMMQAFQKVILEWRDNQATPINLFDELHQAGFDEELLANHDVPKQLPDGRDDGKSIKEITFQRQLLLTTHPALLRAYFSVPDPVSQFGLPTSETQDMGDHVAIRLQRAVLEAWKVSVPGAKAGQVTVANGGDMAKSLGHLPAKYLIPEPVRPVSSEQ